MSSNAGTLSATPKLPVAREVRFRILFPFDFEPINNDGRENLFLTFETALLSAQMDGEKVWEAPLLEEDTEAEIARTGPLTPPVPRLYTRELLPTVRNFLFGRKDVRHGRYFRLTHPVVNTVFRNGVHIWPRGSENGMVISDATTPPLWLLTGASVELFLYGSGIGVLSISLGHECKGANGLELLVIKDLIYHLSQRGHTPGPTFAMPHPRHTGQWQLLNASQQSKVQPLPSHDAPIIERIGKPGGLFTLDELKNVLFSFVEPVVKLRDVQGQFSLYTVVRFGMETKLSDPAIQPLLAPLLSGLAQLEEADHPGSSSVANSRLNPNHWSAVGTQAAVHFLADQYPLDDRGNLQNFDAQRVNVVMQRYFIIWLLAELQLLHFRKAVRQCAELIATLPPNKTDVACLIRVRKLRMDLLEFDALAFGYEVSERAVHNRYYSLVQEALNVERQFQDVVRAINGVDSICQIANQAALMEAQGGLLAQIRDLTQKQHENNQQLVAVSQTLNANVEAIKNIQTKVEYVEIFLVAVYSVYLIYYLGSSFGFVHAHVGWAIIFGSGATAALAFWKLDPTHGNPKSRREVFKVLVIALLLVTAYLGTCYWLKNSSMRDPTSTLERGSTSQSAPESDNHPKQHQ